MANDDRPKLRLIKTGTKLSMPFFRNPAKVVLAPMALSEPAGTCQSMTDNPWPHKTPIDLQSLDAGSLRGIIDVAHEPSMLHPEAEMIVGWAFRTGWLDQSISISKRAVWENVRAKCREAGIKSPPYQAVARRIDSLFLLEVLRFHPLTREKYAQNPGDKSLD
ncbi:hypothetical protein [Pseudomonas putida]|uniref:hypothetical protein n=1 Tax=Pseudomonas putida TaxID=303 RepID=UPI000281E367|nr:hypothetical protein [Pseudomonas putida]EMR47947.1 hypothetical protein PPUTLS46_008894 [Pseudomonas putida LS46]